MLKNKCLEICLNKTFPWTNIFAGQNFRNFSPTYFWAIRYSIFFFFFSLLYYSNKKEDDCKSFWNRFMSMALVRDFFTWDKNNYHAKSLMRERADNTSVLIVARSNWWTFQLWIKRKVKRGVNNIFLDKKMSNKGLYGKDD